MSARTEGWLTSRLGLVRLRQVADQLRHRLVFVPVLYVVGALALSQVLLAVDRALTDQTLPDWASTTVPSARTVFAAIAGGLITSITLLLSMMLVAVQLASSQFSPRTLRDWLGNRTLQHAVGIVLGTAVFCLLALRTTRDIDENGSPIVPHLSVLVAVVLGVVSLVAVVRAVDRITHSLRIGSVASRVASNTVDVAKRVAATDEEHHRDVVPESGALVSDGPISVPSGSMAVEAERSGWVQQIDQDAVLLALPPGATAYVTVDLGEFVAEQVPVMWVAPPPADDGRCRRRLLDAVAVGDSRTMQQDVEFGIVQLTDIAVRALSPGVNDPGTATDVVAHLGRVLLTVWQGPAPDRTVGRDGRTVVRRRVDHASLLERAIGPIRRYGAHDPEVLVALVSMLGMLERETERRSLPGPLDPIRQALADIGNQADRTNWNGSERARLDGALTAGSS